MPLSSSAALTAHPRRRRTALALALSAGLALGVLAPAGPGSAAVAPAAAPDTAVAPGSSLAPFDAVDQFIGTELDTTENKSNDAYGNTYPGAALPFGMVQPSPTTYKVGETNDLVREKGGYEYTADQIRGFGMTRYSGTGCHTRFGGYEFPTIPYAGALGADGVLPRSPAVDHRSYFLDFSHDDEVSEPGYYAVTTADGVGTELTATRRTALSRFDFSEADGSTLVLDASGANNRTFEVDLEIDPETRTVSGSMFGTDVCDNGNNYRAHFSTTYDQPFASFGTWTGDTMAAGSTTAAVAGGTDSDQRHRTGGWVSFADDAVVTATTGFSYVSVEAAAANSTAETAGATFDDVRADARTAWEEALGTVEVAGGTDAERTKLYTALYHSLLQPTIGQDADGAYLGFDGQVRRMAAGRDFFRRINFAGQGWDMYRSQAQLIAMLFPQVASDINASIVLLTQQAGAWSPGAARMSGDNYQVILSTLDAFGATDYDRRAALDSMLATQQLPATASTRSNGFQYFATGMIENAKGDSATSRVLEYAVDDFAIARLAERLGEDETGATMMARAQNWLQVFDPQTRHIRPRSRNGFDRGFDLRGREGTGGGQFNQSTGHQYGWMVPHNIGELVERRGGREASMRALDVLMAELDAGAYTQTGNYLSNEAALTTPWVYHWLQAPHKTSDVLRRAVTELYDTTPSGLPGNDDEGALSAWYVFANLGISPTIHGTANLLVTAPMFEQITLRSLGTDRVYEINAPGAASGQVYPVGLEVDGVAQTASWVGEEFGREGGTLDLTMSATPGTWGTGADDVPPSYGGGVDARNNIGTSPDGARAMGSMDLSDWSFSRETLAARGAAPGARIPHGSTGITFTWPQTQPGRPDNWIPHGQRIELEPERAASISFLGLATNGPSSGTAVVEYTDGSTQQVPLTLNDWTGSGNGNTELVTVAGRNRADGTTGGGTFKVFGTRPAPLDPTRTVQAVRLPQATYNGVMHVFDVATSEQAVNDPDAPTGAPDRIILTSPQDPATSQYVTWRSRSTLPLDGRVEVRTTTGTGAGASTTVDAVEKPERTVDGYPSRSHSAKLSGLSPSTTYEYRVGSGTSGGTGDSGPTWSPWARFETASASADPFTFLYFGDAQEGIDTVWPRTVDAAWAATPEAELSLYAGDMVNTPRIEKEWDDWFGGIVTEARTTTSLSTPGNHEIGGEPFMEHYLDSFEFDANGPVATDAGVFAATYGEHIASVLKDSVTYSDRQGVRFVVLNANRDDICPLITPPGLTTFNCDLGRQVWMSMQAEWLDRVLAANPHEWSVVMAHQPVFSTGVSGNGLRDEDNWRRTVGPVLERRDVDLVLQGHDHTYGRGFLTRNASSRPGTSTGPVYVVANAGEKQYTLPSATDNIWTRNNATAVVRAQDTSSYQRIRVEGDTLTYRSIVTHVRPGGAATTQVGDTLDAFTITQRENGAKWVTEDGVAAPGPEVPSEAPVRASSEPFSPETFAPVVWDDDFETDRLARYATRAGAEPAATIGVDTAAGVLRATAEGGRRWTHLSPPVEGGERWAVVVEPRSFAGTRAGEDSLFVGASDDNRNLLSNWYNHTGRMTGYDLLRNGAARTVGRATTGLSVDPGDRIAFVHDHGQVSSWIEEDGRWRRYNVALASYALDDAVLASWRPTIGLRLDPGTIALDRVTVLAGERSEPPAPVTPAPVTFEDRPGTAGDTYTVPVSADVEYLLGDAVVAAGTYPGTGTVTVTARATGEAPLAPGAVTSWSQTFSTDGGGDVGGDGDGGGGSGGGGSGSPAPVDEQVVIAMSVGAQPYGTAAVVRGTLRAGARPVNGPVTLSIEGRALRGDAVDGTFAVALPADLRAGPHTVTASFAGAAGLAPASATHTLVVDRARPRVRLRVGGLTPRMLRARGTRVVATVRVSLPGSPVVVSGRVKVRLGDRTVTARVREGRARVRMPLARVAAPGRVTATFLASPDLRRATARAVLRRR